MNDQVITMIGMVANFVFGYIVSKNAGTGAKIKKLIPVGNFVVALLTQVVAAANTTTAGVAVPAVAVAGFFGTFKSTLLDVLYNALIQTLVVTGAHSGQKNLKQAIR